MPLLSLGIGIASAVLMKRTPERAWWVTSAACGSFVTLALLLLLARTDLERLQGRRRTLAKLGHYAVAVSTQSMIQLNLFFSLPFYWEAASGYRGQWAFLAALAGGALITLWDPLYGWWIRSGFRGGLLQAVGIIAGLGCALPMLGLSNRASLWIAAGAAALGAPLLELMGPPSSARARIARGLGFVALPITLLAGAAVLIPPAPLRLVDTQIGTGIAERTLIGAALSYHGAPAQLVCSAAIAAPRGLSDGLFHVWRHDGVQIDRIRLEISGGREEGYRTWSTKKNLGPTPNGVWSCRTETALGQRLGEVEVRID